MLPEIPAGIDQVTGTDAVNWNDAPGDRETDEGVTTTAGVLASGPRARLPCPQAPRRATQSASLPPCTTPPIGRPPFVLPSFALSGQGRKLNRGGQGPRDGPRATPRYPHASSSEPRACYGVHVPGVFCTVMGISTCPASCLPLRA